MSNIILGSVLYMIFNLSQFQVLFGLSASVNVDPLAGDLLSLLSNDGSGAASSTIASSEYKMRTTVNNLFNKMLTGVTADFLIFWFMLVSKSPLMLAFILRAYG